jgi:signal peptidase II
LNRFKRFLPGLWAPAILIFDFLTKRLVLGHAETLQQRVEVLGDFFRLAYVRNPGAAMGLFPVGRSVLITVSILATILLVFLFLHTQVRWRVRRAALAAITGGALGNLVDRIFYDGLVIDFIDIGIRNHRFYTFNVADMGVTLGGLVLFISLLRGAGKHHRPEPSLEEPQEVRQDP